MHAMELDHIFVFQAIGGNYDHDQIRFEGERKGELCCQSQF